MKRRLVYLFFALVLTLTLSTSGFAQQGDLQPAGGVTPESSYSLDVSKPDAPGLRSAVDPSTLRAVSVIATFDGPINADAAAAAAGGEVIHRYTKVFNGASIVLPGSNVAQLAALPGVSKVYLDELMKPDTEVSPGFIGAPTVWNMLGGQGSAGEGVIVGVLDTGIWPEHPSFSDPDPAGNPFPAPPVVPGSNGFSSGVRDTCDFGNTAYNPNDADFTCNNKLIGAYSFIDTYKAVLGLLPEEFDSARDDNGHGTHTASTAAGNGQVPATLFGVDRGLVSGIAPRAHVIMYRVCGDQGCYSSDSAAAVEQAILDKVDAINFSISGGNSPYSDLVSLAFLSAYENGVFVAASAGNSGPAPETTGHREPWVTTVAASTSNRHFFSTLTLMGDNGDTLDLVGATVTDGIAAPTPVIFAPTSPSDPNGLCLNPFPAGTFNGEIVICQRGSNARVSKSYNVAVGGAAGMILYNPAVQGLNTDNHFIPSIHIDGDTATGPASQLLGFMASHTGVTATFTPGTSTVVPEIMASFSSRGGPNQSLGISKPDITAPGVQILAGQTPLPATEVGGKQGELFQAIAGTSMSSPHIAGSGALLAALHPDWTPGQIKSALMTTAKGGVVKEDGVTPVTPFDVGSGRVDLNFAGNPGLTFDETAENYMALETALWNSNYPSLYHPRMPGILTVQRTVTSVYPKALKWLFSVESPADVKVSVPLGVLLQPGASYSFNITVDASRVPLGEVRFATLYLKTFINKEPLTLKFPITIVRRQPVVTLDKTCTPGAIDPLQTTECTINITNTSTHEGRASMWDSLPKGLSLDPRSSIIGGWSDGNRRVLWSGTLFGAEPPTIGIISAPGTSPAGYLPLSLFGISPIAGMGDETIVNYTVPSFLYAGQTYTRLGITSNGYLVVGGGTTADLTFENAVPFPNPARPNNVLAPYFADLNPAAGGAVRIGVLTDGTNNWIIVDYENVPNYGTADLNSFQVWIETAAFGNEDISFTYGSTIAPPGNILTVGAENDGGTSGGMIYFNGTGDLPTPATELKITSAPAAPGETKTVIFKALGTKPGAYTNCAYLTSDLFQGTNVACFSGMVNGNAPVRARVR